MPTLILSPLHSENARRLWRAASSLGWRTERLHHWKVTDELRAVPEPVLYAVIELNGPWASGIYGAIRSQR